MKLIRRCLDLRQLLKKDCVMLPGCFNGLTARLAAQHGFEAIYLSGGALTAASGVPDIGLRTLPEFTSVIRDLANSSNLPILADADTGFGEGEMCARTVTEYFMAGASGLHMEDQVFPKRCGHLKGKALIPKEEMATKIRIAREASLAVSQGSFIICARTDARHVTGIEDCISRSLAYIEAGADMIFPEGLETIGEFEKVGKALRQHSPSVLLLANMTEFGVTEMTPLEAFRAAGYNCVIYPVSSLRVAMRAVDELFADIKQHGTQKKSVPKMQTRDELYKVLQYKPGEEWFFPKSAK